MRPRLTAGEIFAKNFTAQKFLVTREAYRGDSSSPEQAEALKQKALYYEAIMAYSKEEYASATLLFEQYLEKSSSERKEVALYLGICYLSTQQLQAAKKEFAYLLKNGSNHKKQDAEWYLVLTLLKEKKIEQVKKSLSTIITHTPKHAYQEKAQVLLKEIQQQYQP